MKIIKSIFLFILIFTVLYFGLQFYFSQNNVVVSEHTVQAIHELKIMKDELSVFEQKIQDLRSEQMPYAEEEVALENLKKNIYILKKKISATATASSNSFEEADVIKPLTNVISGVPYQNILFAVIIFLIVFIVFIYIVQRLRARQPKENVIKSSKKSDGREELINTLEQFKNNRPTLTKGETTQMSLGNLKNSMSEAAAILEKANIIKKEIVTEQKIIIEPEPILDEVITPPPILKPISKKTVILEKEDFAERLNLTPLSDEPKDNSDSEKSTTTVEEVFALEESGCSIEEISEKLRIDQNQVRLMLKFKQ